MRTHSGREVQRCKTHWGSKSKPAADALCTDASGWEMVLRWGKQIKARLWKDLLESHF